MTRRAAVAHGAREHHDLLVRPASKTAPCLRALALVAALAGVGCSSVGGSAVRTGPYQLAPYSGPVAIYPTGQPPQGAIDLGVIEVHAAQTEATVDNLLPQFVQKAAQIGGNVAVIDGVRARFEMIGRSHVETFYYTCGSGATCAGTRVYSANDELMVVSMFGRAFSTRPLAPAHAPAPAAAPPPPPVAPQPVPPPPVPPPAEPPPPEGDEGGT